MTSYAQQRAIMKAAALGESQQANALYNELDEAGREAYSVFIVAMFANAMGVRFKDDQSLEAVRQFAAEMEYDFRDAAPPVKRLTVELAIRAMMGEEHLFDEISAEDQTRVHLFAIRKIVDQNPGMQSRLDEYLHEAANLTHEWSQEE